MSENHLVNDIKFESNTNDLASKKNKSVIYEIMHMEKVVAAISSIGRVINESFMPYDLYLEQEEENDIETMINNLNNFYHWCASRVMSLDRTYLCL